MRLLAVAAAVCSALSLASAQAAPQILALITTHGAKPLTCEAGACTAEFSAFCMQPDRAGPGHDSAYDLAEGADLALVAILADGSERRLPAAAHAAFASQRGYGAVRVSVPETLLQSLGAVAVSVEVGRHVALLPRARPEHNRPQTGPEIAAALGPNRQLGEDIVDNGAGRADGARLLSYMINALPVGGEVPATRRDGLWEEVTPWVPAATRAGGEDVARDVYARCLATLPAEPKLTLRRCLEQGHDRQMWWLNRDYWNAVKRQS